MAAESRSAEELQALKVAYQQQQGVLAAAQQHEALLQQQAQALQQELEQLRGEAKKSGQYSDLQRQFQEVLVLPQCSYHMPVSSDSRLHTWQRLSF